MISRVGQMNTTLCNMVAKSMQQCCTNMFHLFFQGFTDGEVVWDICLLEEHPCSKGLFPTPTPKDDLGTRIQ